MLWLDVLAIATPVMVLTTSAAYYAGRNRERSKLLPHARRYKWLRLRDLDAIQSGGVFAGQTPENVVLNGDDLDAAIDAAMRVIPD